jgi:hypothetical protein
MCCFSWNIIGSLGTIVTFWCCGTFERGTVGGRINPELENALIQAGYGQGISGETTGSIQMRRTQTFSVTDPIAFSFCLHVGNAGTGYHTDSLCGCLPDTVKKELSICEVCRNSSMTFEIGQGIFVSEQGQKFHLTRYCSTFKNLQATEYSKCTACGTPGDSMRDSVLRQRRAASSSGMPEYLSPSAAEDG